MAKNLRTGSDTAELIGHCQVCGWPIVNLCCNDGCSTNPPYAEWDWWAYCSNPTCEHHVGEGYFQDAPEWWLFPAVIVFDHLSP